MYVKRFGLNTKGRDIAGGDVHGHFSYLWAELVRIGFDPSVDRLFLTGDLVDRGPENIEAHNWLKWVNSARGNHDDYVARYKTSSKWLKGVGNWFTRFTPEEQEIFATPFRSLPIAMEIETRNGLVGIVHASCAYKSWKEMVEALNDTSHHKTHKLVMNKCMFNRTRFEKLDDTKIKDIRAVVVGHNPTPEMLILGNTYYIDTEGWKPGRGKFTLLDLDTLQIL